MKTYLLFVFAMFVNCITAQVIGLDIDVASPDVDFKTGEDVIGFMHQKYFKGPCKSYTFSQKNTHYRNDSIIAHSEWHEYIEFPDKFRIDFGDKTKGDFIIFKNDSSYRYKNFEKRRSLPDDNILLLLLGGMYYREKAEVYLRLKKAGFNLSVLSSQKWNKQSVYILGAMPGDTTSNQIWINKKTWRIVRIIEKQGADNVMDITFDAYQKHCNGYTETKVTFKRNGKIEQVEEYYNIKKTESFAGEIFNPKNN